MQVNLLYYKLQSVSKIALKDCIYDRLIKEELSK